MPGTTEADLTSAATLLREVGVVAAAYRALDEAVIRHSATSAWMVLRPPGCSPQIFSAGRRPVPPDVVAELVELPTGVYVDSPAPTPFDAPVAFLFEAAFRAEAAARDAAVDLRWGLASRRAVEAAVARAAAAGARYGWQTCAVLLTTRGPVPAAERWPALVRAVRAAVRGGDEAGVVTEGTAVVLLGGHPGSDAVRPFLARLRAELSRADAREIELHAATATTPAESVDPAELWRLAAERLADLGLDTVPDTGFDGASGPAEGHRVDVDVRTGSGSPIGPDELHLRTTAGVVCVSLDGDRLVSTSWPLEAGGDHRNGWHPDGSVVENGRRHVRVDAAAAPLFGQPDPGPASNGIPSAHGGQSPANGAAPAGPALQVNGVAPVVNGNGSHGNGATLAALESQAAGAQAREPQVNGNGHAAPLVSASGPGEDPSDETTGRRRAPRVELAGARFDGEQGLSEIVLSRGRIRTNGKAPAGPLAGGAQATLHALRALGFDVPFYLVSAERVRSVPGEPVVVMLAPRGDGVAAGAGERIGIASSGEDVEGAGRATLNALNRFLSRAQPAT